MWCVMVHMLLAHLAALLYIHPIYFLLLQAQHILWNM